MASHALETELAAFERILPILLKATPGKVALLKGEEFFGVFDTDEDAIDEGMRLFGRQSFLARKIVAVQDKISIPALTLGLIRAVL